MTDAVEIFAFIYSRRHDAGMLAPVIRSAVGVVRESAGLVCNVAELGLSLVLDTRKTAPTKAPTTAPGRVASRPVHGPSNVIPFPTPAARGISRPVMKRG
jgi:hypothetical protein